MDTHSSLAFRIIARVLRLFPALIVAFVIVSLGMAACQFFTQAPDQLFAAQSARLGSR